MSGEHFEIDKPRSDILDDDDLGVKDLAIRTAKNISSINAENGFVIGVHGSWGIGKTTFLNFIKSAVFSLEESKRPEVMEFNPWLFSNRDDLVQRYLNQLSIFLGSKDRSGSSGSVNNNTNENFKKISHAIQLFSCVLFSKAKIAIEGFGAIINLIWHLFTHWRSPLSLEQHRSKIEELLRKSPKKILVIIDDMDRLEHEEVMAIFRMVKAVANFPNIIYILSFDKDRIHDAIENNYSSGKDYLEKIIQYSIDLPQPSTELLIDLLGKRIQPLVDKPTDKPWDNTRYSEFYRIYLKEKLQTLRQVKQIANSFNVNYSGLIGQVDPVDFFAIEALKIFSPKIYNEVKRSEYKFVGLGEGKSDVDKAFFEKVIASKDSKEGLEIEELLIFLFPRVNNALKDYQFTPLKMSEYNAGSRVCSLTHFPLYFNGTISEDRFSDTDIQDIIKTTDDTNKFSATLVDLGQQKTRTKQSRIPEFLNRISDLIKAGKVDSHLKEIVKSLIIIGDKMLITEDKGNDFFRIGNDVRNSWVIYSALDRMQQENRYSTLKCAFEQSTSIYTISSIAYTLGRENGLYGDRTVNTFSKSGVPFIAPQQVIELARIVENKIVTAAADGTLLHHNNLHEILYRWADYTGNFDNPRQWVSTNLENDDSLVQIITKLSGVTIRSDENGVHERTSIDLNSIKNFIDVDATFQRLQQVDINQLNEKQRNAIIAYIEAYKSYTS